MPQKLQPQVHNRPRLKANRTKLRHRLTPAEATLWIYLKGSNIDDRKFRRQHSVGKYILDFYCPSERLGIELDGEVHYNFQASQYDNERRSFLNSKGIKVLRFENKMVFEEIEAVIGRIKLEFGWWDK